MTRSSTCQYCGDSRESESHVIEVCPRYAEPREELRDRLADIFAPALNLRLMDVALYSFKFEASIKVSIHDDPLLELKLDRAIKNFHEQLLRLRPKEAEEDDHPRRVDREGYTQSTLLSYLQRMESRQVTP